MGRPQDRDTGVTQQSTQTQEKEREFFSLNKDILLSLILHLIEHIHHFIIKKNKNYNMVQKMKMADSLKHECAYHNEQKACKVDTWKSIVNKDVVISQTWKFTLALCIYIYITLHVFSALYLLWGYRNTALYVNIHTTLCSVIQCDVMDRVSHITHTRW